MAPEGMVLFKDILGQCRHGLRLIFMMMPNGRLVGIHPVERETFLHIKFVGRVVVEDDLAEQAVDVHHRDLAGNRHVALCINVDIFAGLKLAELLRGRATSSVYIRKQFCESSADGM